MFFRWPSTKVVHVVMIHQKKAAGVGGVSGGGGDEGGGRCLFSLYIYIENLKKVFLSETTGPISV